jgi:hypothetical protein
MTTLEVAINSFFVGFILVTGTALVIMRFMYEKTKKTR